jgi:hypothetical protein
MHLYNYIQQEDSEVDHLNVGEETFEEVGAEVAQEAEGEDDDEDNVAGVVVLQDQLD